MSAAASSLSMRTCVVFVALLHLLILPGNVKAQANGAGWVTVRTEGVAFPFPAYLENASREIDSRFIPSSIGTAHAELGLIIRRDGSMVPGSIQFLSRSGDFAIDLAAQQAVEQTAAARAFGPLPMGFSADVLPVVVTFANPSAIAESAKAPAGASAPGATPASGEALFQFQVDKPAFQRDGNPAPKYPESLESSRVEGEVLVQFVVDTLGRVDTETFKVLHASNKLFAVEILKVLPRYRYFAAEAGGKKVKQYVQSLFSFKAP
jgi:outer membrane biosynthesis protein TonB